MIKTKMFAVSAVAAALLSMNCFITSCGSTPAEEPAPVVEEPVQEEKPVIEAEDGDFASANSSLLSAVEASRKLAIEAGAEEVNSVAFKACEADYETQKALIAGGTKDDLSKALNDLNTRYLALAEMAAAKEKKNKIDAQGFASYNQKSYDDGVKALEALGSAQTALLPGDVQLKNAKKVSAYFDAVLADAYRSLAKDSRKKAVAAKKNADSVKAAVSRKADYEKAVKFITDGDSQFVTGGAEQAVKSYADAERNFTQLYGEISEKRAKAQAAIEEAKKRVELSEQVAAKADIEKPLGDEKPEGIEDENTQLLEADDFTAQENSAAVIADEIESAEGDAK